MPSPRQAFEDNMRPAELLLRVYRLLENDHIHMDGDLHQSLCQTIGTSGDESVMLIYNEIFYGIIRERAQIPPTALKRSALNNLLRQSVVAACTGLDAYLPALLQINLPVVIAAKGRNFMPQDSTVSDFFSDLTFNLAEVLRLIGDDADAPLYIANKILKLTKFKYLSSKKGVHAVGALLGVANPWDQIADQLRRDKKELMNNIEDTTRRRNDIVHRADRAQTDPSGDIQEISYSWAKQSVDTIMHVCLALDELVATQMEHLRVSAEA
jgi:hypothetical protein